MNISQNCLNLVRKWEGFYENAYLCPAKVWTIGYGTTVWPSGVRVKKGDKIIREEATKLLEQQVNEHAITIGSYIKVNLNQNQYDALASFQYNLGRHILKDSALLRYLNNKQWQQAANEMLLYNKARVNGVLTELRGLTDRRKDEVSLFLKEVEEDMVFGNKELEGIYNTRKNSPATEKLLVEQALRHLNLKPVLVGGKVSEGDKAAIAYELAVHFSKIVK